MNHTDLPSEQLDQLLKQTLNVAISHKTSHAAIAEMAVSIKNLTPEQLARVIIKAANKGLSEYHLSAIIIASQQALNTRQQFGDRYEEVLQLC